jgi:hypothetical protein
VDKEGEVEKQEETVEKGTIEPKTAEEKGEEGRGERAGKDMREGEWEGLLSWKHGNAIPIYAGQVELPPNTTINIVSLIESADKMSEGGQAVRVGGSGLGEVRQQLRGRTGVAFSSRFLAYLYEQEGQLYLQLERPALMKAIMRKLIRLH